MKPTKTPLGKAVKRRIDERKAAAMREALKSTFKTIRYGTDADVYCPRCGNVVCSADCQVGQSLSSDAGRDYVHKSELEKVQKEAAVMREFIESTIDCCCDICSTDDQCNECRAFSEKGKQAFSSDAGRDYVALSEVEPLVEAATDCALVSHICGDGVAQQRCDACRFFRLLENWRKNHPKI